MDLVVVSDGLSMSKGEYNDVELYWLITSLIVVGSAAVLVIVVNKQHIVNKKFTKGLRCTVFLTTTIPLVLLQDVHWLQVRIRFIHSNLIKTKEKEKQQKNQIFLEKKKNGSLVIESMID